MLTLESCSFVLSKMRPVLCFTKTLLWLACLNLVSAGPGAPDSFTVYSAPIKLRYGEVYNMQQDPMNLPQHIVEKYFEQGKAMALLGFDVEMLRIGSDGKETPVKLSDHYLHHYILAMGDNSTMKKLRDRAAQDKMFARMLTGCHAMTRSGVHSFLVEETDEPDIQYFGSAAGAEYRHNPQRYQAPFRRVIKKPHVWAPTFHVINIQNSTRATGPKSPLLFECPCTPQRKIDVKHGKIDGEDPYPPIQCSPEFAATGNPSCSLQTYVGGWRCCEHGVFVIDTDKECGDPQCSEEPVDEVYMKLTFYHEDVTAETRPMSTAACCDVTSTTQGVENIEYDVPACGPGTPIEKCLHIVESVQPVAYFHRHPKAPNDRHRANELVDLVFAAPHLHVAGLAIELVDDVTNVTLCSVRASPDNKGGVMYGNGDEPGNEEGFLVGLRPCSWDGAKAPRFQRNHPLRTRVVYNASEAHTGVMSLWLMDVSAVPEPDVVV
mmetsp:Transcript_38711/g.86655  ORF Transcript_38711/g.86655 Transcript_38711/m.86655 type:complete len:491 (+) Transcript_38711:3-1475(+)